MKIILEVVGKHKGIYIDENGKQTEDIEKAKTFETKKQAREYRKEWELIQNDLLEIVQIW